MGPCDCDYRWDPLPRRRWRRGTYPWGGVAPGQPAPSGLESRVLGEQIACQKISPLFATLCLASRLLGKHGDHHSLQVDSLPEPRGV